MTAVLFFFIYIYIFIFIYIYIHIYIFIFNDERHDNLSGHVALWERDGGAGEKCNPQLQGRGGRQQNGEQKN